jgi:hypothetical protein
MFDYAKFNPLEQGATATDLCACLMRSFGDPKFNFDGQYEHVRFGKKGIHGLLNTITTVLDNLPVSNPDHDVYLKLFEDYVPKINRMIISYCTATISSKFKKSTFGKGGQHDRSASQDAAGEYSACIKTTGV